MYSVALFILIFCAMLGMVEIIKDFTEWNQ